MDNENKEVCNICLEDITHETGKMLTSCNHVFHYYCLTSWFYKEKIQLEETFPLFVPSSCPCCRKKFSKIEDLPTKQDLGLDMDEDSEDESLPIDQNDTGDEDMESVYSEDSIELYTTIDFTRLQVRITFNTEQEERTIQEDPSKNPDRIATKIQAIWRGYRERCKYADLRIANTLLQMANG
jgi:hypothetical protein